MRRGIALLLLLVLTAGCLGGGSGSDVIRQEAAAATVGAEALAETGYEEHRVETAWLNTSVRAEVSGDVEMSSPRDVEARTQIAEYRRGTDRGPAAFVVYSTPAVRPVENVDETVNLAAERDTATLAGDLQSAYGAVTDLAHVENRTVALLGNETTLRVYEATATTDGERVDVTVYRGSVEHGGDHVTVVAVLPADDDERLRSLVESVIHEK